MRWRSSPASDESARARFAGTLSFALTLALIAVLALAKSAQASPPPAGLNPAGPFATPPAMPLALILDEEAEGEAGEGEEDEGEEAEAEEEAAEEEEEEGEGESAHASAEPPYECVLRAARATVVVLEAQSKLRLQLTYTSFEPAPASVDYRLRGGKGSLHLAGGRERLSEGGVLHNTVMLGRSELAKAIAANALTVRLRVPGAPRYCKRYSSRVLKTKRVAPGKITWLQSGSVFGS